MDEFSLINTFFKPLTYPHEGLIFGIGDDAACLKIPNGMDLLISSDTLIENVHFLNTWSAYDIAYKALMVNVSDIAAMGGTPHWLTLALTLPKIDKSWLTEFSRGLGDGLNQYQMTLIGGDTTQGTLSITITIHGLVPHGKAVRRCNAAPGDIIYLSGEIGGAALGVDFLTQPTVNSVERSTVMKKLLHPKPRVDLAPYLLDFATAAIDVSDGLSADLNHICQASRVGACIEKECIPIHPLVIKHKGEQAFDFALSGGDDYELCFTIAPNNEKKFLATLTENGITCFRIGVMEATQELRVKVSEGNYEPLSIKGYNHF